jgi:hypothetical protein
MELFGELLRVVTLVRTAIGRRKEVLANIRGLAESDEDDGEVSEDVPLHGVVGLLVRPRARDASGAAVGIAVVTPDRLIPISMIDRRISEARGEIAEGAVSLAGYLGQHVTLEDGSEPGQAKIGIEIEGATITIEGGLLGPTITVSRDGPPPSSITLGPDGNIALVGVAITFNGIPLQVP